MSHLFHGPFYQYEMPNRIVSFTPILEKLTVMVSLKCQLNWATGYLGMGSDILGASVRVFLGEIST